MTVTLHNASGHCILLSRYADTRFDFRIPKQSDEIKSSIWHLVMMLNPDWQGQLQSLVAKFPQAAPPPSPRTALVRCGSVSELSLASGDEDTENQSGSRRVLLSPSPLRTTAVLASPPSKNRSSAFKAREIPSMFSSSTSAGSPMLRPLPSMFCGETSVAAEITTDAPEGSVSETVTLRKLPAMFRTDETINKRKASAIHDDCLQGAKDCAPAPASKADQRKLVAAAKAKTKNKTHPSEPAGFAMRNNTDLECSLGCIRIHHRAHPASSYITTKFQGPKVYEYITDITESASSDHAKIVEVTASVVLLNIVPFCLWLMPVCLGFSRGCGTTHVRARP